MDALKASMLLKVSSVTKSQQRLLVDMPCMRHALMAKSGNPSSAARLHEVLFTLPSKFECAGVREAATFLHHSAHA